MKLIGLCLLVVFSLLVKLAELILILWQEYQQRKDLLIVVLELQQVLSLNHLPANVTLQKERLVLNQGLLAYLSAQITQAVSCQSLRELYQTLQKQVVFSNLLQLQKLRLQVSFLPATILQQETSLIFQIFQILKIIVKVQMTQHIDKL